MNELERAAMLLACGAVMAQAVARDINLQDFTPAQVWGYQSEQSRKFWRTLAGKLLVDLDKECPL